MGRRYAGMLGSLAFAATMIRGLLHNAGVESTLWSAAMSLAAFTAIGWLAGAIANSIVMDFVHDRVADEASAHQASAAGRK